MYNTYLRLASILELHMWSPSKRFVCFFSVELTLILQINVS